MVAMECPMAKLEAGQGVAAEGSELIDGVAVRQTGRLVRGTCAGGM